MRAGSLVIAVLIALGSAVGAAQHPAERGAVPSGPIRLNVVVHAKGKGKPETELGQSNFTVLDNGVPQPIQSFRAVSGQTDPVKVLLVIDAVNIPYQRLAYERQEIGSFLRSNEGRLPQPTSLAIVADTGTQIAPKYSTDGNLLSGVLEKQTIGLRDLRRSAGFYGATERLDLSLKALDNIVAHEAAEPGRKFIVWISPGWPLLSGPEIDLSGKDQQGIFDQVVRFSDALRAANVTLYAVDPLGAGEGPGRTFYFEQFLKGIAKPSQAEPGDLGAQVLAVQSGGLFLSSNNDLGALFQQPYDDAATGYEITYQPPPSEKERTLHRIDVRVSGPGLVARTRQDYYSEP